VSASNGGTPSGNSVVWSLGSIAAGGSGQRQVSLQVAAKAHSSY